MDPKKECEDLRKAVKEIGEAIRRFKGELPALPLLSPSGGPVPDRGEMIANATLAYRHLEDARMRLGKVIQAYDGGVSVYDR